MDPQLRLLLELTYEAIIDAGMKYLSVFSHSVNIVLYKNDNKFQVCNNFVFDTGLNPKELRGRRIGVYVGVSSSETEEAWTTAPETINGYGLTGCCRAMFANRISYTFDFKGN